MSNTLRSPLRAIDLFCGAGGLSEGFRNAGYEIPFALDFDADSCQTYALNHPETHVEYASIADFTPEEIAEIADRPIDVVLGGPSCQSFSTAGRRTGWVADGDERNNLWEHMFAIVEHLRPRAFLMENVPGMVYWGKGAFGQKILDRFTEIGYNVTKDILLAADWGVPQRRRRLFIVGVLSDENFEFPDQTHMGGWRRDSLELWEERRKKAGLLEHLTVWDAIGDLPKPVTSAESTVKYALKSASASPFARKLRRGKHIVSDHEVQQLGEETVKLISQVPIGGTWRDIPPHLLPDRYRGMRRTDSTNLLGRLDPNLPSYTITTQFNNVTTGCFTHPLENRALSVREGARLQTFPDTYRFVGSVSSRCRQIGNAVPPLLASVLANQLAVHILGEEASEHHRAPEPPRRGPASRTPAAIDEIAKARIKRAANQDTAAERVVQEALSKRGVTFELHRRSEPSTRQIDDIVLTQSRVAVFVNGCFWHGCEKHARNTKSGTFWWGPKIEENQKRDRETKRLWLIDGWEVVEIWEHEDPDDAARHIEEVAIARTNAIQLTEPSKDVS